MQPASLIKRFLARWIDASIVVLVFFSLIGLISLYFSNNPQTTFNQVLAGISIFLIFLVSTGIGAVWTYKYGQTIGKKIVGIKTVDTSGGNLTRWRVVIREIVIKEVAYTIGIIAIVSCAMVLVDENKRLSLHDLLLKTMVVETDERVPAYPIWSLIVMILSVLLLASSCYLTIQIHNFLG